ncbi:MAG TPA: D-aminoacyl-tRNA deacylase [bacterium]|nr:D-aminoacyl-tRNA deacylase [bacterium]
MITVIQRVSKASVSVEGVVISSIGKGLLVFAGLEKEDGKTDTAYTLKKINELRIFEDSEGKMNRSIIDTAGELLVVSQFTLAGNIHKGRRPGFDNAMEPQTAQKMFDDFVNELSKTVQSVKTGRFGAHMEVSLINNGPVTFIIDSRKRI